MRFHSLINLFYFMPNSEFRFVGSLEDGKISMFKIFF